MISIRIPIEKECAPPLSRRNDRFFRDFAHPDEINVRCLNGAITTCLGVRTSFPLLLLGEEPYMHLRISC